MTRTAHVIGAGIGGLATAAALSKRGWQTTIHERGGDLREIGAGIYIKANSIRVLRQIDCFEAVIADGELIKHSEIRDHTGRAINARTMAKEEGVYTVLRADLHRELANAAQRCGVEIETNSEVTRVTPEGLIETAAGRTYQTDLIIGADGANSLVRKQIGAEVRAGPMISGSTRILIPRIPEDGDGLSFEHWHHHMRALVTPVTKTQTYICASAREDDRRATSIPFDIDYWTATFPKLGGVFARVDPNNVLHHRHSSVRVSRWSLGCVAILGDAVHAQPPNFGQGAGLAIANGGSLADFMDPAGDIQRNLAAWEAARRPVTEEVQRWSENWDHFMHRWPRPVEGLRSAAVWLLANVPATRRRWGLLYKGETSQRAA